MLCYCRQHIFVTTCSVLARLLITTLLTNYTNVYFCKASLAYSDIRIISKRWHFELCLQLLHVTWAVLWNAKMCCISIRWRGISDHRIIDPTLHISLRISFFKKRRNPKQVVEMITGHGHWLKQMQRIEILSGVSTCGKWGEQEETTADHFCLTVSASHRLDSLCFVLCQRMVAFSETTWQVVS